MTDSARLAFREMGRDVTIHDWVRIVGAEHTTIGSHVLIDDFVFLDGRGGLQIGSWVHISMFASIHGGGAARIGDFSNIAAGARVLTGADTFDGTALVGAPIPDRYRRVRRGLVVLEDHVVVGANAVVFPDVTVGQGAILGAGAVATSDIPPWIVAVGAPARAIRKRPAGRMLELAEDLRRAARDCA
jgi:acetyltransferase-like isoleucine patch superfamily enzyme